MNSSFKKGSKIFDNKKQKPGIVHKVKKPAKGSPLESEPFVIDIKYDDGTTAINMPIGDRFILLETELTKGIAIEKEHDKTLKKVESGELTASEAVAEIAKDHLAEDPKYYEKLEKVESTNPSNPVNKFKTIQTEAIVPVLMKYGYENVPLREGDFPDSMIRFEKPMQNSWLKNYGEIKLSISDNLIIIDGKINITAEGDPIPHEITIYRDIDVSDTDYKGLQHNLEASFIDAREIVQMLISQKEIAEASKPKVNVVERKGTVVYNWDQVPAAWKNLNPVKKVNYVNSPYNKELIKLLTPFVSDSPIDSNKQGINFADDGITVTNGKMLVHLPYPNPEYTGHYATIPKQKYLPGVQDKIKNDLFGEGSGFQLYQHVIPAPADNHSFEISIYKLLQYTQAALNYANETTKLIKYKFNNELIGINGEFLTELLEAMLKLGHEKINIFLRTPNKPIVFSPDKNYELHNSEIFLIMPVILDKDTATCGAADLDFERYLDVCFDLSKNEIINYDGSVADFKMTYDKDSDLTISEIKILNKYAGNNPVIIATEFAKAVDGDIYVTDFITQFKIKNTNVKDGLYRVQNGAIEYDPVMSISDFQEFPEIKSPKKYDFEFKIDGGVLKHYIEKAVDFSAFDDIRPTLSGIHLDYRDKKLFLVSTNAHIMMRMNITEYVDIIKASDSFQAILKVDNLNKVLALFEEDSAVVKINNTTDKTAIIENQKYEFITIPVDGKYPNYNSVIPIRTPNRLKINVKDLFNCVKSKEAVDFLKLHKKQEPVIFDKISDKANSLDIYLYAMDFSNHSKPVPLETKICTVGYSYEEGDFETHENTMIIMPAMHDNQNSFAFKEYYFRMILDNVNCEEIELSYSAFNRAYVIGADCLKYKHTINAKKSVVEKAKKVIEEKVAEQEKEDKEVMEAQFSKPDPEVVKTPVIETNETQEAIDLLTELAAAQKGKEKKQTLEAIELLKDLL